MRTHDQLLKQAAALALALTCSTTLANAQGALVTRGTVLMTTGDTVNGGAGETFASGAGSNSPSVDENGQVVFWAQMLGGAVTNAANDDGYFRGTTKANTSLFLRGGDAAPGLPGLFMSNAALALSITNSNRLSPDGRILFGTLLSDPITPLGTTVDSALMGGVIGSIGVIGREGDAAPGTVGAVFSSQQLGYAQTGTGLSRTGRVFFQSSLSGGDTITAAAPAIANNLGMFTGLPGSLELILRKGDAPAGAPGTVVTAFGSSNQMNDSSQVAYIVTLSTALGATPAATTNNTGIWLFTPGSGSVPLLREGDPAPGTVGATFANTANTWSAEFGPSAFNASGQAGGWWQLLNGDTTPTGTNNAGLYRASTSGHTLIIRKGDVAPGTGGATVGSASNANVLLNNNGKFLVQLTLTAGTGNPVVSTANDNCVFVGDENGLTLVMREGQPAPGMTGGENINAVSGPYLFNDAGQALFTTTFTGGTATLGMYSFDPFQGVRLQLNDIDTLEVQPGVFKATSSWLTANYNPTNAATGGLNHAGKFATRLTHALTGSSIVSGEIVVPTPTTSFCFGDGSGTACPCANSGATGRGCSNSSFASGAVLTTTGIATVTPAYDSFTLIATDIPGPGLFFQGDGTFAGGQGVTFGDGLLCSGGAILRLGVVFPTGATASYPGGTTPNPIHIGGLTASGDVRNYQCWYRDSPTFCTTSTYNLTQSVSVTWVP